MFARIHLLAVLVHLAAVGRAQDEPRSVDHVLTALGDGGRFEVAMTLPSVESEEHVLRLAAWKPGAYRIEAWQKLVDSVIATDAAGADLEITRTGEREWRIRSGGKAGVRVVHRARSNKSSAEWLCCEGPPTFLQLVGAAKLPCRLRVVVPEGWTVATGLDPIAGEDFGYRAPDWDTFADCPIEMGRLTIDEFDDDGKKFYITYNLTPAFDRQAMIEMCRKVVRSQAAIFGGYPFDRYYFMWHLQTEQEFTGGLEHLNSTTLMIPQFVLRQGVEGMADLVAHEFFHLWNVKRIRPVELGPFDLSQEARVRSLWLSEGVTDYYAGVSCVRAGIWPARRYLIDIAQQIGALRNNSAYGHESVEEASLRTWDRSFFIPEGIDYYGMGKLLGLLLDIEIRVATENKHGLDAVLRALMDEFGLPKAGFKDADIVRVVNEVAGVDLTDFFSHYVAGTEDLPFERLLPKAGIVIEEQRRTVPRPEAIRTLLAGIESEMIEVESSPALKVTAINEGTTSPFQVGDVLMKVAGRPPRWRASRPLSVADAVFAGARRARNQTSVAVELRRGEEIATVAVEIPTFERRSYGLSPAQEGVDDLAARIRRDLLEPSSATAGETKKL